MILQKLDKKSRKPFSEGNSLKFWYHC